MGLCLYLGMIWRDVNKDMLLLGSSAFYKCQAEIDPILTEGHFISFQLGRCFMMDASRWITWLLLL